MKFNLILITTLIFTIVLNGVSFSSSQKENLPDLKNKLAIAYKSYINCPTRKNAQTLKTALEKSLNDDHEYIFTPACSEYIYSNLGILNRNIEGRSRDATRAAFCLLKIVDGAFYEDLSITLGKLIRIDTKLFIEELKYSQHENFFNLDFILNTGYEFVDSIDADCYELKQRIDALEKVNINNLIDIRDQCVKILKKEIELTCNKGLGCKY